MDSLLSDFELQLETLLRRAGKKAFGNPTPDDFTAWFVEAAPKLMPALLEEMPPQPAQVAQLLRVASRGLYGELPMPANGLVAAAQPKQGRNDACACGSGRKFKHCCGAVAMPPLFSGMNLLRYVLDAYPKRRLAEVASSRANLDAVADTAYQWDEEGNNARAAALLEPYFEKAGPLGARLAPLFNLLMDNWLALGRKVKREQLIDDILLRGDKILRSDALQRRTTMLADRGDHAGAWRTFRQATELNPNDPALGFLEVTTLLSEGRTAEAQGRAQWWAAHLAKQRDPSLADLIERLREIAKDAHGGMLGVAMQANQQWRRLNELFLAAPAPAVRHQFEVFTEEDDHRAVHQVAAELVPDAELAKLEQRWQQTFPQAKPSMTTLQNGAGEVWDNATDWLDLLQKNPSLWFSFDVLDDLVMAIDTIAWAGVPERLLVPVAERAAEQLRLTLESGGSGNIECHWGVWPNRPALRPVAHLAFVCKEAGNWQRFMELAHWLVFDLNPNDNHGLRADLSCAHVRFARWGDVIAVDHRYANDMNPTLQLNALLATFVLGDTAAAQLQLQQAAKDHPTAVKLLLARAPKPVEPDSGYGIAVGGKYEAWLYVSEMRPFWEQHLALDWARAILAKPRRNTGAAAPGQDGLF